MSLGNRRTIAFFLDWMEDSDIIRKLLGGMQRAAEEEDINLLFISTGNLKQDPEEDYFAVVAYHLMKSSRLDGIILKTAGLTLNNTMHRLEKILEENGRDIPIISLELEMEGCGSILFENRKALEDLTHHLFRDHHYKNPCIVAGPHDYKESNERLEVFRRIAEQYGISIGEDQVFYGYYMAESGQQALEFFLDEKNLSPDCIICANDMMALGVLKGLKNRNLTIAVTGYDDTSLSSGNPLYLSTVSPPESEGGYSAVKWISRVLKGERPIPRGESQRLQSKMILRTSCGCSTCRNYNELNHIFDVLDILELQQPEIWTNLTMTDFTRACQQNRSFNHNERLEKSLMTILGINFLYMCTWEEIKKQENSSLTLRIAYEKGEKRPLPEEGLQYPMLDILPEGFFSEERISLVVEVLRDKESPAGLLFTEFREGFKHYYESLKVGFSGAISAMNLSIKMHEANEKLLTMSKKIKEQSLRDELTGLYNRRGFFALSEHQFEYAFRNKKKLVLFFFDLDGLKRINDTWGHLEGDKAIIAFAKCLIITFRKSDIAARQGGDEFILLADYSRQDDLIHIRKRLTRQVEAYNRDAGNAWKLDFSMGPVIIDIQSEQSIQYWIDQADSILYEEKRRKKGIS